MVNEALGFDFDAANVLKHDGKTLAGAVELPILGKEAKLATLDRLCLERGLMSARRSPSATAPTTCRC